VIFHGTLVVRGFEWFIDYYFSLQHKIKNSTVSPIVIVICTISSSESYDSKSEKSTTVLAIIRKRQLFSSFVWCIY